MKRYIVVAIDCKCDDVPTGNMIMFESGNRDAAMRFAAQELYNEIETEVYEVDHIASFWNRT